MRALNKYLEVHPMSLRVTLIQGGEIGHDLVPAVKRVLEAAGVAIDWDEHVAGYEAIKQGLDPLPAPMLESVRRNGLALKTKLMPDPAKPLVNYNVQLRRTLQLFATVRPLKNLRGLKARFSNVDMLVIREITRSEEHTSEL